MDNDQRKKMFLKAFGVPIFGLVYSCIVASLAVFMEYDGFLEFLSTILLGTIVLVVGGFALIVAIGLLSIIFEFSDDEKKTIKFADGINERGIIRIISSPEYNKTYEVLSFVENREFKTNDWYHDMLCENGSNFIFWFWVLNHKKLKKASKIIEQFEVLNEMV